MVSLILILLAVGAYFLLKKNLIAKFPQLGDVKIGALIGVPLFYMTYSLSEVSRLWGAGNAIFNTTGYQHLMSGTDAQWDANILASAINNMESETRNAWAFVSMAESCSQYLAIIVVALGAVMIYKLFNPEALPKWKYQTLVIISGICCVFPYLLYAFGLQNIYIWLIFVVVAALFGWTYYIYKNASLRMADVPDSNPYKEPNPSDSEATKQCPYCGETILAVAKKCKHCGEWLSEQSEEIVSETKYIECPICGEEIEADAQVCPYCKEAVPTDIEVKSRTTEPSETHTNVWQQKMAQSTESSNETNNRKKYIWIAIAVVTICLLFWYFGSSSNNGSGSSSGYDDIEAPSWDNDDDFLIN